VKEEEKEGGGRSEERRGEGGAAFNALIQYLFLVLHPPSLFSTFSTFTASVSPSYICKCEQDMCPLKHYSLFI
jgi:cytochrome c biogenesis factor